MFEIKFVTLEPGLFRDLIVAVLGSLIFAALVAIWRQIQGIIPKVEKHVSEKVLASVAAENKIMSDRADKHDALDTMRFDQLTAKIESRDPVLTDQTVRLGRIEEEVKNIRMVLGAKDFLKKFFTDTASDSGD